MNSTHKLLSMLVVAGVMLAAANAHAGGVKKVIVKPSQLVDLTTNSPCPNPLFADQKSVALDHRIRPDGVRGAFEVPTGKTLVLTEVSLSLGDPSSLSDLRRNF